MDTPTPKSSLPQVRTFAKDLERKRATVKKPVAVTKKEEPKVSVPVLISDADQTDHEYRAPSWSGKKPVPKPSTPAPEPKVEPEEPPKPNKEPTPDTEPEKSTNLRPIAAAKPIGDTTIIIDNEEASTATIIRDTKKDRFKLFPAIFKSISSWFGEQVEKQKTKKIPKYTVP